MTDRAAFTSAIAQINKLLLMQYNLFPFVNLIYDAGLNDAVKIKQV